MKIALAIAAVIAVFLVVVALRNGKFTYHRSIVIAAPASEVFPHVNDFKKWLAWSPWENLDPALKRTYDGAPAGKGASYGWAGNAKVGEGRMTIVESRPSELIRIKLEFIKPFAATNTATFTFKPEGSGTQVTWTIDGEHNFICKGASLFVNMDKMMGENFEKGLAALKSVSETGGAVAVR